MKKLALAYARLEYENKILYVKVKEDYELTKDEMHHLLEAAVKLTGEEKYYALVDTRSNGSSTMEARHYYSESEFSKFRYADAFIVDSLPLRIMVNFYMRFNSPPVPTRMFASEPEARKWLETMKAKIAEEEKIRV